jgi:hypothetical protein
VAVLASSAANVTLKTSDAIGTTNLTGSTNWNNNAVPSAGNAYFTSSFTLRTTNATTSGGNVIFQGGSLSIDAGGRLLGKSGNNVSGNTTSNSITVTNLILNGGNLEQAGATSDNAILTVAGNLPVNVWAHSAARPMEAPPLKFSI